MEQPCMAMIVLSFLAVGQAVSYEPRISPPLHDGSQVTPGEHQSDKKFFGPPFPADYPEDKRPVPDKHILDKLKGPEQPYPALQSKADFDADYVKDENSDTGAWQAQFEYDGLRKKLAQQEADERRAEARAAREGRDVDGAQRDSDAAADRVRDALKGDNDAAAGEEQAKTADDFGGPPSAEKLEELKKAVQAAEDKLEEQKKAFEICKKQLEDAKTNLEELKAQHDQLEKQLAADTKLWAEKKAVKLNLKKTQQSAASGKVAAAKEKLAAAEKVKAAAEKELAKEKAESEKAQANLHKEKSDMEKATKQLEAASAKLQKIHGYTPAQAAPSKSDARVTSVLISLWMVVAMQFL